MSILLIGCSLFYSCNVGTRDLPEISLGMWTRVICLMHPQNVGINLGKSQVPMLQMVCITFLKA